MTLKMLIKIGSFSLEIKMKMKARLSRKKKYVVNTEVSHAPDTESSTFQSFDDIDPWQCCSESGQDISYSCVLETRGHWSSGDHDTHQDLCLQTSRDSHYACSNIVSMSPPCLSSTPLRSRDCCHQYWDLDTHSLLVES